MSNIKNAIDDVLACTICNGKGFEGWFSEDKDFDYTFCECNPYKLIIGENA